MKIHSLYIVFNFDQNNLCIFKITKKEKISLN